MAGRDTRNWIRRMRAGGSLDRRDRQRWVRRLESEVANLERSMRRDQRRLASLRALIETELAFLAAPAEATVPARIRALMSDGKVRSTAQVSMSLGVTQELIGDAMKRMAQTPERTGLVRLGPGFYWFERVRIKYRPRVVSQLRPPVPSRPKPPTR